MTQSPVDTDSVLPAPLMSPLITGGSELIGAPIGGVIVAVGIVVVP